jgi:hypothetical protein
VKFCDRNVKGKKIAEDSVGKEKIGGQMILT